MNKDLMLLPLEFEQLRNTRRQQETTWHLKDAHLVLHRMFAARCWVNHA